MKWRTENSVAYKRKERKAREKREAELKLEEEANKKEMDRLSAIIDEQNKKLPKHQ